MTIATFSLSETYLHRALRLFWGVLALAFLFSWFLLLFSPTALFLFSDGVTITFLGVLGVVILVIIVPIGWSAQKHQIGIQRATKVILTDVALERIYQTHVETIPYETITQVTIWETRQTGVHTLKVVSPQTNIILTGYRGMNRLSYELNSRLTPDQRVQRKPLRFDNFNLWHLSGLLLLFSLVWIWNAQTFGSNYPLLGGVFQLVAGLVFLFARPQTKLIGKQRRNTEIVVGILFLLMSIQQFDRVLGRDSAAALWSNPCSAIRRLDWTSGCVHILDESEYTVFTNQPDEVIRSFRLGINQGSVNAWIGFWTPLWLDDGQVQGMNAAANHQRVTIWRTINATQDILEVWDIPSQSVIYQITGYLNLSQASQYALSPDGRILALVNEGHLTLWNIEANQQLWTKPDLSTEAVTFSPDGQYIITHQADSNTAQFIFWQVADGSRASIIVHPAEPQARTSVIAIHMSPDGRWFAAHYASPNYVAVWDTTTGNMAYQFALSDVYDLQTVMTFSANSQFLIAGFEGDGSSEESTNLLTFWRLTDGTLAQKIVLGQRYNTRIHALDVSPDGQQLAVGMRDQTFIFDLTELLDRE